MAIAKRTGPDFLFLANAHSQKFNDLEQHKVVTLTFQNSSTQDWVSVTGSATTTSNSDPRIKEIYSKATSAWFGDLGDGVYTGGPEDPRMTLIEVKPNCESLTVYCLSMATARIRKLTVADDVHRYLVLEGAGRNLGVHEGDCRCRHDGWCCQHWYLETDDGA